MAVVSRILYSLWPWKRGDSYSRYWMSCHLWRLPSRSCASGKVGCRLAAVCQTADLQPNLRSLPRSESQGESSTMQLPRATPPQCPAPQPRRWGVACWPLPHIRHIPHHGIPNATGSAGELRPHSPRAGSSVPSQRSSGG